MNDVDVERNFFRKAYEVTFCLLAKNPNKKSAYSTVCSPLYKITYPGQINV